MLSKYIDFRIFLISLALGVFFVYLYQPSPTIIYVYPTPDNINKIQYEDQIGNCFNFESKEISCPKNKQDIHTIPAQEAI